jgi:hypothetical protein
MNPAGSRHGHARLSNPVILTGAIPTSDSLSDRGKMHF